MLRVHKTKSLRDLHKNADGLYGLADAEVRFAEALTAYDALD